MQSLNPIVNPTRVDVQAIEQELTQLWKSAAEPGPGAPPVMRACTLNLIACAADSMAANQMTNILVSLTSSHPHRAILLINDPVAAEAPLSAWVQANCQLVGPGLPQVCGEQVTIEARGSADGQVASLVLALLAPELPAVLWWPGRAPFASPLFARLQGMADRVIVDSAQFADPDRDLVRLAAAQQGRPETGDKETGLSTSPISLSPVFSDLAWTRLTPLRELTAQFFDARAYLPHLRRLDRVEIEYEHGPAGPPNRVQALLLAGWLATRLGWTPLESAVSVEGAGDDGAPATARLHLRRPAPTVGRDAIRLVTVELRPVPPAGHALGTVAALRLKAVDNVLAAFAVERTEDSTCVRTTAEVVGWPAIVRLARVERPRIEELLAAELRLLSHDRTYGDALQMAALFARGL